MAKARTDSRLLSGILVPEALREPFTQASLIPVSEQRLKVTH